MIGEIADIPRNRRHRKHSYSQLSWSIPALMFSHTSGAGFMAAPQDKKLTGFSR
jgi:hypothetical protein